MGASRDAVVQGDFTVQVNFCVLAEVEVILPL
jgi:hypothetical protein